MATQSDNLPPILPVGTTVVTRVAERDAAGQPVRPAGTTGVIVKAPAEPTYPYRVRFPTGDEVSLKRRDFHVLKHYQRPTPDAAIDPLHEYDLWQHVIYRCVIGSQAYGLAHEASDLDRRGIYLPPARMHWSLYGVPEQLENPATEEVYWELEKFLKLALKANPNVLEALWSPMVEHATPLAQELIGMRRCLLSQLVYQTYNGYAMSQFRKLGQDLRNRGEIKWKHAMHLVRLLLAGIETLRTGEVPVRVAAEHRERLLAIRDGQMPWDDVDAWRETLHAQFEEAFRQTTLPERPDYEKANAFLIRARRSMVT